MRAALILHRASAVRIHLPLPEAPTAPLTDPPLITCAMPTRGRPRFVAQSVEYFRRQDYPNRELVIVYEHEADLPGGVSGRTSAPSAPPRPALAPSVKLAVRAARGRIVAHWDDDDWYAPQRLSRQAAPILEGMADITGLNDMLFMVAPLQQFWSVTPGLFARLFVGNISGGTLMFDRAVWERSGPYPATSLREDADFLVKAMHHGARLRAIPGRELYIYVRHDENSWKFAEGRYLSQDGWSLAAEPAFMAADRGFYFREATAHAPCSAVPSVAEKA